MDIDPDFKGLKINEVTFWSPHFTDFLTVQIYKYLIVRFTNSFDT